jgi:hypothetical protein
MGFKKDGSKASTFTTVAPGTYEVFIIDARAEKTKGKGTVNVNMKLKIRDDDRQEFKGQQIFHSLYLTPNTEGMVHGFLDAIGIGDNQEFKYDFVEDEYMELADEIAQLAKGKPIQVKTKIEEYNGNEYARVSSLKASEVGGEYEVPEEDNRVPIEISEEDLPF